ncbi:MAG: hypothetical protein AOA65_1140 [Candidatus Bathyarchaeota archaeon BA1]|nr:MAG: hypothetical protein AOA65_1140 [Candidatus Bathyarchaeota archaeon BA1]
MLPALSLATNLIMCRPSPTIVVFQLKARALLFHYIKLKKNYLTVQSYGKGCMMHTGRISK